MMDKVRNPVILSDTPSSVPLRMNVKNCTIRHGAFGVKLCGAYSHHCDLTKENKGIPGSIPDEVNF
jgi:hypothetical protein